MIFSFGGGNLFGGSTSDEAIELVRFGEKKGFEVAWFSDNIRDPYAVMGAASISTGKIRLGLGVTDPFKRHPLITARSVATVDELSKGRVVLGIGTGAYIESLKYFGVEEETWRKSGYKRCEEMISLLRQLFQGNSSSGMEFFKMERVNLLIESRQNIPIYVAGAGPNILGLAGEVGDGAMVWAAQRDLLRAMMNCVRMGLRRSGRAQGCLDVVARVQLVPTTERKKYLDIIRPSAALKIMSIHPSILSAYERYIEVRKKIEEIYPSGTAGGPHTNLILEQDFSRKISELVPDEVVDMFAIIGEPRECISRIKALEKEGLTHINVINVASSLEEKKQNLADVAERIIPLIN